MLIEENIDEFDLRQLGVDNSSPFLSKFVLGNDCLSISIEEETSPCSRRTKNCTISIHGFQPKLGEMGNVIDSGGDAYIANENRAILNAKYK